MCRLLLAESAAGVYLYNTLCTIKAKYTVSTGHPSSVCLLDHTTNAFFTKHILVQNVYLLVRHQPVAWSPIKCLYFTVLQFFQLGNYFLSNTLNFAKAKSDLCDIGEGKYNWAPAEKSTRYENMSTIIIDVYVPKYTSY